jgi:hypothetical protein
MITELSVSAENISIAWAKAFLSLMEPGADVRHPAMVTIRGFAADGVIEDEAIRTRLDQELKLHGKSLTKTVAGTIFPLSMWNPALPNNADALFKRYEKAWPGIKKCPQNRLGVYFRRLTAYEPKDAPEESVNQLEFIIENYMGNNHRKSAMQAAIFDPTRDHTKNPQKGFPCMQQVAFTPLPDNKLSITGFYATQYQFEKAYGNYLGLYHLGRFMAQQLNMELVQVVCMASVLKRGDPSKGQLAGLAADLKDLLSACELESIQ